jgi:hypothetical protein
MLWAQITLVCIYVGWGAFSLYREGVKGNASGAIGSVVGAAFGLWLIYMAGGLNHIFGG